MSVTFNQKAAGPFGEESKWASFKIEDVCENSMGLEYFQQRFTRKDSNEPALDLETCTIEPVNTLRKLKNLLKKLFYI